jgi:hypothetical protein
MSKTYKAEYVKDQPSLNTKKRRAERRAVKQALSAIDADTTSIEVEEALDRIEYDEPVDDRRG